MKSSTPEQQAESDYAAELPPQTTESGRHAAVTALLQLVGIIVLAFVRPKVAGTVGVMVAIIVMIMLHELGHFVMAKRAGMKVTEFFLGFGPRLWSIRRGETEYGVKAIPAGGYVRIIGMSNVDEVDPADEDRTYRSKAYRHRLGVAVAGSAMHMIIAAFLLFMIYAAVGLPAERPVVGQIVDGSPAKSSQLQEGDRIVAVNGQAMETWEDIPRYVQAHGEGELIFTVERKGSGQRLDIPLRPRKLPNAPAQDGPKVGIAPERVLETKSIPAALGETVTGMPRYMWTTVKALGGLFSPNGLENYGELLTGDGGDNNNRPISPIGAARVAGDAVNEGWGSVLLFLFAINIFVGIFNMVPLLPLDGGHVAIATYEKIASTIKGRRVQVDVQKLMPITAAVFGILVLMGLTALYLDIFRPISGQ